MGTDAQGSRMAGIDRLNPHQVTEMLSGGTDTIFVSSASADQTVDNNASLAAFTNCRFITCDTGGIIKLDLSDSGGVTKTVVLRLVAGAVYPIRNVTKVYRYYVATTPCTALSFSAAGVESVGIHLWR